MTIQKLKLTGRDIYENTALAKINELVDAVNDLKFATNHILEERESEIKVYEEAQDMYDNAILDALKDKQVDVVVELADLYAEQRRWIGKLCKFWFADAEHPTFGILDFVDAGPHPEPFHINCGESEQGWYPHCEPVLPTDNAIYKGGGNE